MPTFDSSGRHRCARSFNHEGTMDYRIHTHADDWQQEVADRTIGELHDEFQKLGGWMGRHIGDAYAHAARDHAAWQVEVERRELADKEVVRLAAVTAQMERQLVELRETLAVAEAERDRAAGDLASIYADLDVPDGTDAERLLAAHAKVRGQPAACAHDVVSFGTAAAPASRCVRCHRTWAVVPSMARDDLPSGPPCPCDACVRPTPAGPRFITVKRSEVNGRPANIHTTRDGADHYTYFCNGHPSMFVRDPLDSFEVDEWPWATVDTGAAP